jgi:hypothetical protein
MSKTIVNEPQSQPTSKFAGSVGGTVKSMLGGASRSYFILEHKTQTSKYKIGKSEEFIGDYVELGRGSKYAVSFGEDCSTVSRPHAAIVRQGEGWVLRPLSRNNPTLLNNRAIQSDTPLGNGDQIQLSHEGPKMIFLATSGLKVGTLGLTARFNAMRREALRPYRTALWSLAVLLVAVIGLAGYEIICIVDRLDKVNKQLKEAEERLAFNAESNNKAMEALKEKMKEDSTRQSDKVRRLQDEIKNQPPRQPDPEPNLAKLHPSVFYIQTDRIEVNGKVLNDKEGNSVRISGSGFLLEDGRFVTARHVAQPWLFNPQESESMLLANYLSTNEDAEVIHYFKIVNENKQVYALSSKDISINDSDDEINDFQDAKGNPFKIRFGSLSQDWASIQTNLKEGLKSGADQACSLKAATPLHVLGHPLGVGAGKAPVYSEVKVGRDGCQEGLIWITSQNIDSGNSGGPVFHRTSQGFSVVGVVSAKYGSSQGVFVPLSKVK